MTSPYPWAPLPLAELVALFAEAPCRWWVSGGLALELHAGRSWREHADTDVGVLRGDLDAVRTVLRGWDVAVASAGRLRPWQGEALSADRHENNLWCRRAADGPFELDVTVGAGDGAAWAYRRDPSLEVPWEQAVRTSRDGIPYLAPHLQLLLKSRAPRSKDHHDADEVLSTLAGAEVVSLASWLPSDHAWRWLLPE